VELAGHARGSGGSAAPSLGPGVSTTAGTSDVGPAMPGARHPGRARAQRLITAALLCAIAAVCTTLALTDS